MTRWISKYTNGVEIKSTRKVSRMNKGRKTTFEERIEIAQYTIANDLDYQKSMEKYDVSYSQVYAWVRKYKSGGEEALKDNRGRNKPAEELDDHERLKLRIKELEARNEYLEMENALAKSWQRSGDDIHANVSPTCRLVSSYPRTARWKAMPSRSCAS
ncbi:helix-turn-helix domain-containing protein [Paenibacillus larvae]|nr:helix-turn-helix domain-containing protein [Paenibacillus larvae]MDT2276249.1 helix-turn-helix domain-containing protein [Paenibacillus larvae]